MFSASARTIPIQPGPVNKTVPAISKSNSKHTLPPLEGRVFWLIPAEPAREIYQKEINRLAEKYNSVPFLPHLTVGRFINSSDEEQRSVLRVTGSVKNGYRFPADEINCRTTPYQNLVHSLKTEPVLETFESIFDGMFSGFSLKKEEFHVSLLYGRTECKELQDEKGYLRDKLPDHVSFSEAHIIELDRKVHDWITIQEKQI